MCGYPDLEPGTEPGVRGTSPVSGFGFLWLETVSPRRRRSRRRSRELGEQFYWLCQNLIFWHFSQFSIFNCFTKCPFYSSIKFAKITFSVDSFQRWAAKYLSALGRWLKELCERQQVAVPGPAQSSPAQLPPAGCSRDTPLPVRH